jgi:hypothetical protein
MGGVAGVIQTIAAITGIAADATYLHGARRDGRREATSPQPMGDLASTITSLASTVGIATSLANDPYLAETVCHVGQIKAINAGQVPPACPKTAAGLPGGVGLGRFQKPLRAYVYAEQHPWVYAAVVAGVVGVPLLLGYMLGKGSR